MPMYDDIWEGTSPNAARAFEQYRQSDDFRRSPPAGWDSNGMQQNRTFWDILFGRNRGNGSITSQPLPAPPGGIDMDPTMPFGGPATPPPQAKPATQISSAAELSKKISAMIGGVQEPPPVNFNDFFLSRAALPGFDMRGDTGPRMALANSRGEGAGWAPFDYTAPYPRTSLLPRVDMPTPRPSLSVPSESSPDRLHGRALTPIQRKFDYEKLLPSLSITDEPAAPMSARQLPKVLDYISSLFGGGNSFGGNQYGGSKFGGNQYGLSAMNPFVQRANGGQIPGFMRGGYPDLYDLPIRRAFDSGGESYVGKEYGDSPGREDDVNARLSAREYVVDAETMALLGDGNPDAGAKKMDTFRKNIRKQKGKALAQGKISPNAKKSAAEYLAGNPMGDGLRRRGKDKG